MLREVRSPATPLAFLTQVCLNVASPPALPAGTAGAGRGWYAYTRVHATLPGRCEPLRGRHAGEPLFPPAVLTSAPRSRGCPLPGGWGLSFHLGQNSAPWPKRDIPVWILKLPTLVAKEKAHGSYRKEPRGGTPGRGWGTSLPSQSLQRIRNPSTPPPNPPPRLGEEFAHDFLGRSSTRVVFLGPQ